MNFLYKFLLYLIIINCFILTNIQAQNFNNDPSQNSLEQSKNPEYDSLLQKILLNNQKKLFKKYNQFRIFPVVSYSQETSLLFGVSGVKTFIPTLKDSLSRISNLNFLALYSLLNQKFLVIDGVEFFNKEKIIMENQISYTTVFSNYWGLGQASSIQNLETYTLQQLYLTNTIKFKTHRKFFVGFRTDFHHEFDYVYKDSGLFAKDFTFINKPQTVFGLGPILTIDSRNDAYYPNKGWLVQLYGLYFTPLFGSKTEFTQINLDVRKFLQVKPNNILAFQLYGNFNFGTFVNVRYYSRIGGPKLARGYYDGRFIDKNTLVFQTEFRTQLKLFKIYNQWLKAAFFFSIGDVFKYPSDLQLFYMKTAFGLGFRIPILPNQKLHLRLDFGFNNWDKILAPPILNFSEAY